MNEIRPAWRWVSTGLLLKLIGLILLFLSPVVWLSLFALRDRKFDDPLVLTATLLVFSLGVAFDVIGRLCCLKAPRAIRGDSMIVVSVVLQIPAILLGLLAILMGEEAWLGLLAAIPLQAASACCFMSFLRTTAHYLRHPALGRQSESVLKSIAVLMPSAAILGLLLLVLLIFAGCAGLITLPFGGLGGFFALAGGGIVLLPAIAIFGVFAVTMYGMYASTLVRMRRAIMSSSEFGVRNVS